VALSREEAGQRTPDRLAVRTVPVDGDGDLLDQLPEAGGVAWVRGGTGLIGWGEAARITLPAGEDRFTAGQKWLRALFDTAETDDRVGLAGCGPVAFGSFTFDPASDGSVLIVPRTVLGRSGDRAWRTDISGADDHALAGPAALTLTPPGTIPPGTIPPGTMPPGTALPAGAPPAALRPPGTAAPGRIRWHDGGLSAPAWQRAVAAAVTRIKAGELGKVVLARDLNATAPQPIDVRVVLRRLAARYPDCHTFTCDGLTGATPELLIRRDGTRITARVLAGTAPRGSTETQDRAIAAALLASEKDTAEHAYAVESVRDVLAPLCDRLDIDPRPSLLTLANVRHLATDVSGTLAGDTSALAFAAALHPTAAVGGTPTAVAMDLIRELEGMDRGRYAGPVGWVDSRGNGEWGIALRCGQLSGATARLFAGCGIVAGSDPVAELGEAQAKFRPMQDALEG
jgi:menaquinone-specific isochorismate synthase